MTTLGTPPPYNTPAWREWRRGGIGASDLPAMLGIDPHGRTAYGVALEKRGLPGGEVTETPLMTWGRLIQPLILSRYADHTGQKVRNLTRPSLHPDYPRLYAHLDGRVEGRRVGVEIKNYDWQRKAAKAVETQALAQIGLARLDAVDVVRMDYGSPEIVTIERNDAVIRNLLEFASAWYQRYVLGDEMPPTDGSDAAHAYLNALPGRDTELLATWEQEAFAKQLAAIRGEVERLEAADKLLVAKIKESMVGSYRLAGDGWHVIWKPNKDSIVTDYGLVAGSFRRMLEEMGVSKDRLDTIVGLYTTTKPGAHPFKFYGKGSKDD